MEMSFRSFVLKVIKIADMVKQCTILFGCLALGDLVVWASRLIYHYESTGRQSLYLHRREYLRSWKMQNKAFLLMIRQF